MAQKQVLGKGLASLFPAAFPAAAPAAPAVVNGTGAVVDGPVSVVPINSAMGASLISNADRHPGITFAAVDEILVNQYQPRREFDENAIEELAQSIKANGVIQPLVVRRTQGGFELIAGERRLRASKKCGLKQVPVVVRRSTDREALELALIENIQREDLNCVEAAMAYFRLMQDFSLTQEEMALRVGKDRATVANHLRLLRLPQEILDDLKNGKLSFGHAKAILGLEDNALKMKARNKIVEEGMSVREAERLVESLKKDPDAKLPSRGSVKELTPVQSRLGNLSQELTRQWSSRVEIKGSERRGKIIFHYSSRQELDRILEAMQTR